MYAKTRLIDDRMGGEPLYYLSQPKGILMRISDQVKHCVGFVGIREGPDERYGGTVFFVRLNEETELRGGTTFKRSFVYMVTAKHIAEELDCSDCFIRLNNTQGRTVSFEAHDIKWWYHPTESELVDSAVAQFAPPRELNIAAATISDSLFATPQLISEYEIGVGDEVYVAGLFPRVTQTVKNQPVVRTGNIFMMPDEKIEFGKIGLIDAYLIETKSFGGLSGCPVFVRHTVSTPITQEPGGPPIGKFKRLYGGGSSYLLGSMIGRWVVPEGTDPEWAEALNVGVSPVVPMYKIQEVLNHPELVEMRKAEMEAEKKKMLATTVLDSAFDKGKTQTTPEGLNIPVPSQDQFLRDLKKVSRKKV
jgi:hypothetical protein